MSYQQYFDEITVLLDTAWALPFSGGKTVVDADRVRDLLEEIRKTIPKEIEEATEIIAKQNDMIERANRESKRIIQDAESRAKSLIENHAIVRQAEALAKEKSSQTEKAIHQIKTVTNEYIDNALQSADETLSNSLKLVRESRNAYKSKKHNF